MSITGAKSYNTANVSGTNNLSTDFTYLKSQTSINSTNIAALQIKTTDISYNNNITTFTSAPRCNINPTLPNHFTTKAYVDILTSDVQILFDGAVDLVNSQTITSGVKTFIESPIVPTPTTGNQVVNKTYCDTAIANLVNSAPSTLDTLLELSNALGADPNYATTTAALIGTKAPISTTVDLGSAQTITGTKFFNYLPKSNETPSLPSHCVNKFYSDAVYAPISTTVDLSSNQIISGMKTFNNVSNVYYGDGSNLTGITAGAPTNMMTTDTIQTITGDKIFNNSIGFTDGITTSSITNIDNQLNIYNNAPINTTILNIAGMIPACNLSALVVTNTTIMPAINGVIISGVYFGNQDMINNLYISSVITTTCSILGDTFAPLNQINSLTPLTLGTIITSPLGSYFTLGTHIIASLGGGNYTISQNRLSSFPRKSVLTVLITLNRPYYITTVGALITLDYNPTINLQVLNSSSNLTNIMAIRQSGILFNKQAQFNMYCPTSLIAPTLTNHLTTKAYVDGITTQKLTFLTISSDATATKPTLNFACDANNTYIQSSSNGVGGPAYPANIVFSAINGGAYPYCIMSPMGISMFYAPVFMYDTLPTPTVNQLGYNKTIAGTYPSVATTFGNNTFTSLIPAGVLIPAGIYSISFSTYVTQIGTTSGSINYIACGLSTTQTGFINGVNVFQNSYVYFPASAPYPYLLATTTKTLYVNVPTTYYFVINLNHLNLTLQIKGSLNNFQYTKIA